MHERKEETREERGSSGTHARLTPRWYSVQYMYLCLVFLIRVLRRGNAFFCTRLITIVKYKTRSRKFGSTKMVRGEEFLLKVVSSNGKYGIHEPQHKKGHLTERFSGGKITNSTPSGTCNKEV